MSVLRGLQLGGTAGAAGTAVVVLLAAVVAPARASSEQPPQPPQAPAVDDLTDWRTVLETAAGAGPERPFRGRVIVASFDTEGPNLLELEVQRAADGELRVGRSEAWTVGRTGDGTFLLEPQTGSLLRLGGGQRLTLRPADLVAGYDVAATGTEQLGTGPAAALELTRDGVVRERLLVDAATGLIVRRETYGLDGSPRRLVAFTELVAGSPELAGLPDGLQVADAGPSRTLPADRRGELARDGWIVPEELPGGFRLAASSTLERVGATSLHLVYTDGLYTLSLYEQQGQLDGSAVSGAHPVAIDDGDVYRWPGSEPERVVWSAHGRTFTAVSDAPRDVVAAAISALPQQAADSVHARLARGLTRVATWVWPFG